MQICMGISKQYWTLSSGIGMWLSLRQMKILVKFLHLWEDYEGIPIEDYEGTSYGEYISVSHLLSNLLITT